MPHARVLLLSPPTAVVSTEPLLNLGYLAAALRQHGHDVRVVDATAPYRPYSEQEIFDLVREYQPHFIGITLTIDNVDRSYLFLEKLAQLKVPIVTGGPHPNSRPKESLAHGAQIVCMGEGEVTIVELAEYFLGQRPLAAIHGISYCDETGRQVFTAPRAAIADLDTIPFPDFGDFPIRHYTGSDSPESNPMFWSIFSSRGCPFNCIFCSSHNVFGRKIRFRSAKNVLAEIELLVKRFGIKSIGFQDDEILCRKDRFIEFCDLLQASGLNVKISFRTRIDSIDADLLAKARATGVKRLSFGIESWEDETLRRIKKNYDVKTIHSHFKILSDDHSWPVSFNNIVGFPWETRKHYQNIVNEIALIPRNIRIYPNVLTPIPYPQTELYDQYHAGHGFTDWWLSGQSNSDSVAPQTEPPFFMLLAASFVPLYQKNKYWKFSLKQEKDLQWFSWKVFALFLRSHCRPAERRLVYVLCYSSWWLWRIEPRIEAVFFDSLKGSSWVAGLKKRLRFRDQY
ncbi:MAG: B12-binding domain-containing radical SAM protein [Candidatus Omnitrophica bacterium]|nr:B12-binding domain-containing radical SAM protein [Candidatus Omnitrophota bacterium]